MRLTTHSAQLTPHALRARIERYRERTLGLSDRASRARSNTLLNARTRLAGLAQLLRSFSHKSVLERGFALVRGPDGHPLRSTGQAAPGAALEIEVADGRFGATVNGSAPKKSETVAKKPEKQGNLFG